jgi:hypothetical protein
VKIPKLELHQETIANLIPKPDRKSFDCTLNSDVTIPITCKHC